MRVVGLHETRRRNESEGRPHGRAGAGWWRRRAPPALPARLDRAVGEAELEHARWDPKDGELCLSRSKPGETLVEDRSDSNIQINHQALI